jgi:hypothetical protein
MVDVVECTESCVLRAITIQEEMLDALMCEVACPRACVIMNAGHS